MLKVFPTNDEHLRMLEDMALKLDGKFEFWTELSHVKSGKLNFVDIMISKTVRKQFEAILDKYSIKHKVNIDNVAAAIQQQLFLNMNQNTSEKLGDFDYGQYHQLDDINHWMQDMEAAYPKLITIFNVTKSYQRRDILAMKISVPTASKKPALWFDGGIHAREWISPATVIYIAYQVSSILIILLDISILKSINKWRSLNSCSPSTTLILM